MPRIATETLAGLRFDYYTSASGVFTCKLDSGTALALGKDGVESQTLSGCKAAVREALKQAADSRTTTEKVILFGVSARARIRNESGDTVLAAGISGMQAGPRLEGLSFCEGVGVALWAVVANEHKTEDPDGKIRYRYEVLESSIPQTASPGGGIPGAGCGTRSTKQLPWTAEREAFFARVTSGLCAVILELSKLYGAHEDVMQLVDNGGKKLLTQ